MKTRNDLRRLLQDAFDKIEFICCQGDFYSGLEATSSPRRLRARLSPRVRH